MHFPGMSNSFKAPQILKVHHIFEESLEMYEVGLAYKFRATFLQHITCTGAVPKSSPRSQQQNGVSAQLVPHLCRHQSRK